MSRDERILMLLEITGSSGFCKRHIETSWIHGFSYFKSLISTFACANIEHVKVEKFYYRDAKGSNDDLIMVITEEDYSLFHLWVKEMRAAGKALDVLVRVYKHD
jgi:hypothetical protein